MPSKDANVKQADDSTRKRQTVQPVSPGPAMLQEQSEPAALQRAIVDPSRARPADILALQRTAGNQAVSRLIQTTLTVGGAGDRYEQEADRVAEQVVSSQRSRPMGAPSATGQPGVQRQGEEEEVQTKPLAATITPVIQRQMEEEEVQTKPLVQRQVEEEEVQTKPLVQRQGEEEEVQAKPLLQRQTHADGSFEAGSSLEKRLAAQKGGGSPLPEAVRGDMESRFGTTFSGVRIHTDAAAVQMNRELSAQAFTHGRDIYVRPDKYDPGAEAGKKLLAHELTHVIQQSGRGDRIARWGKGASAPYGTSHKELTKEAVQDLDKTVKTSYGDELLEYLGGHADDMDMRLGYLIPVGWYLHLQKGVLKKRQGMYAGGGGAKNETERRALAYAWDNVTGYTRNPAEAPNHAEAGMYKEFGGEDATRVRIEEYVTKATQQWFKRDFKTSMNTLALALHNAQDIGAHGFGRPGTGHDPRRFFPPPNEHAKMKWVYEMYGAGAPNNKDMGTYPKAFFSWCDNKEKNPHGWLIGKKETWDVLTDFNTRVGGGIRWGWKKPGLLGRAGRAAGRFFGGKDIIKHL